VEDARTALRLYQAYLQMQVGAAAGGGALGERGGASRDRRGAPPSRHRTLCPADGPRGGWFRLALQGLRGRQACSQAGVAPRVVARAPVQAW
jgi:hypothetical protein